MTNPQFVACISNSGYEVSLELRKLYKVEEKTCADRPSHPQG